jgi:hypothetical protein
MNWTCKLCDKKESVYETTNGKLFVLHHCRCFGGAVAPGQGRNFRQYVSRLRQFFSQPPVEVSVFPLREVA